jgi:hypothetical protein
MSFVPLFARILVLQPHLHRRIVLKRLARLNLG